MIVGIGMDLVDIPRFALALERHGDRIRRRLFTEAEQQYCAARPSPPASLAARFAAKEAFMKAIGTGLAEGLRWTDVEVISLAGGRPALRLSGVAAEHLARLGATTHWLTLTHTAAAAAATVILEK